MVEDIVIPQVGETAEEEVRIVEWVRKRGDQVQKGEVLLVLETGKGALDLESLYTGTLVEIMVPTGQPIRPLTVVGRIQTE
jgi:pyruvate/2-oxoglutarate dehydrogenase complex dihydrolipoamide acyltransferase (E2) component